LNVGGDGGVKHAQSIPALVIKIDRSIYIYYILSELKNFIFQRSVKSKVTLLRAKLN
jgi:hypothetical protein